MDERSIAIRIKKFRKRKGLTLQKLADSTGYTKSYLSQIEHSKKAPPIGTLTKIAKALGVDPIVILTGEDEPRKSANYSLVRKNERQEITHVATKFGYVYETLAHKKTGKAFESYILTVPFERTAIFMHEGEELFFMLEGSATFFYGEERINLEEGDCIHFNAAIPHSGYSTGDKKGKALCIIYSPKKKDKDDPEVSPGVLTIINGSPPL